MKFFNRNEASDDERPALPSLREARKLVPASAQSPDAQRLSLYNPDEEIDEGSDEDLAFLHSLIGDKVRDASPRTSPPTPTPTPVTQPEGEHAAFAPSRDDLDVFREMASLRTRTELAKALRVDAVDMGELLEELQTTRAALRHRRKAA
jgi:hypothetical protein